MEKIGIRKTAYFLAVLAAAVLIMLMIGCAAETGSGNAADDPGRGAAVGSDQDAQEEDVAGPGRNVEKSGTPEDAAEPGADTENSGASEDARAAEGARSAVRALIMDGLQAYGGPEEDAASTRITGKEVYRLEPCVRVSRKEIKKRGGAGRWFRIYKIRKGDRVYKRIAGRTYRPGGQVALSDLRYIRTLYLDFSGKVRSGEIIVNRSIAEDTLGVFRDLYRSGYQISKMKLVDEYFRDSGHKAPAWSDQAATDADTASMNDDNTSGFNYRTVAGTGSISMHGYGRAIDVNPFENPWCPGGTAYYNQKESSSYADRGNRRDHMIYADSDITKIFKKHGFRWLGETGTRDYQHFEK